MADLRDWQQLTPHLYIWDYVVNFAQYHAPFPNLQVLARNIRVFRDHHVIGIQEEAQYQTPGGEFAELKAWLLAHLLWNPEQETQPLIDAFVRAYYGAAADAVLRYIELCRQLIKPETVMGIYIRHDNALYTDEFISASRRLLDDARQHVPPSDAFARGGQGRWHHRRVHPSHPPERLQGQRMGSRRDLHT